jgi:hypothetical protein
VVIKLSDPTTGFWRNEDFFRTAGAYAIHDVPAGQFTITYSAEGGQKQQTVTLAEGEHKTGVDIELDPLVTITGRVIELGTQKPVPGMTMMAAPGKNWYFISFSTGGDDDHQNVTDDAGRFSIAHAPGGVVTIRGYPKSWQDSDVGFLITVREVQGTGTIDVGDLPVIHRRVKRGDPVGDLGVHWVQLPPGTPIDEQVQKVAWIDPTGPAAKSGLVVGDVVVSIDGIDITGANSVNGWILLQAPPGTTIRLGLARGATVSVTLAPPS